MGPALAAVPAEGRRQGRVAAWARDGAGPAGTAGGRAAAAGGGGGWYRVPLLPRLRGVSGRGRRDRGLSVSPAGFVVLPFFVRWPSASVFVFTGIGSYISWD